MKRILVPITFLLFSMLLSAVSFAKCANSGLSVWPHPGVAIKQNPIFVLDAYAFSMSVIDGLNSKYPVYLKSGNKKIKLTVKETLTGQFRIAQAILVPSENLEAGKEYELCIDSLEKGEGIRMYDNVTYKPLKIKWKVVAGLDKDAPQFTQQPKYLSKSKIAFGCGPGINVNFTFAANDSSSNYLVKATVKDLASGKKSSYYLGTSANRIVVGHGMCAGAFELVDNAAYEVEFSLMDVSGNITQWASCPIAFTGPTFSDKDDTE